jgi:hypothetical protein
MVLQACRLNQPNDMPVAMYKTKKDKIFYLTGNTIAELLRKAVKAVCPDTATVNLKKYSAHSLHIWAYVLLDKAGKSPEYIKKRLRWLGNSFRMYLRDSTKIQSQHLDALQAASQEVMDLIAALPDKVIAVCTMTDESAIRTCMSVQMRLNNISLVHFNNYLQLIIIFLFHLRS